MEFIRRSDKSNKILKRLQTDDEGYELAVWLADVFKQHDFLVQKITDNGL